MQFLNTLAFNKNLEGKKGTLYAMRMSRGYRHLCMNGTSIFWGITLSRYRMASTWVRCDNCEILTMQWLNGIFRSITP